MSLSIEEAYKLWLKGSSLRKIAREIGISHGRLHCQFIKAYGDLACNVTARSLVRSVISDYEGNDQVATWATSLKDNETVLHRSKHSLNQLTSYQTLRQDWIAEQVANPEQDQDSLGFLKLPLYLLVSETILDTLSNTITGYQGLQDAY